ncbi:unnamed protein product [Ophioblennius macclurei]
MKTEDLLRCEEQLRTTLHCDDKEKLRKKLAQLQREYLRTAQRLQRAERQDAVRRHVRSRLSQQNQTHPEVRPESASLTLTSSDLDARGVPDYEKPPEHSPDVDDSRKSQAVSFMLPSGAALPQTSNPSPVTQSGLRPSSGLRLRSRRSRLRLERRSSADSEKKQDQSDRVDHDGTAAEEKDKVKSEGVDAVHESDDLFSSTESVSPSLLLTHWNAHGCTDTEDVVGKTVTQEKETRFRVDRKDESDLRSPLLTCENPLICPAEKRNDTTENKSSQEVDRKKKEENFGGATDFKLRQENYSEAAGKTKSDRSPDDCLTIKESSNQITGDEQSSGLQETCTIVEGLLFPAEYYVRTTRRMSSSQTQPDMQAVILSQLNVQQRRRSRGRGRGQSKSNAENSNGHIQTNLPSQKTFPSSADSVTATLEKSGENSDSASISQMDSDAVLSQSVTGAPPARGRRKRGRGRGRPQARSKSIAMSLSQCPSADGTELCFTQKETFLVQEEARPGLNHCTDSQLSPAVDETESTSGSGQMQKVFPMFMKAGIKATHLPCGNRGSPSCQSLLLPSASPTPTSPLPLPSLSPLLPIKGLSTLSILDFHLPDEQFASLKLQKLRNVALELGIEHFSSPSHNTRSSYQRFNPHCFSNNSPVTLLPLPLSVTPTLSNSPHADDHQAATLSVNLQNLSTEHKRRDESINQPSTDGQMTETCKEELTEKQTEIHSNNKQALLEFDQANQCGENQRSFNTQAKEAFSSDFPLQERPKEPSNASAYSQTTRSPGDYPVNHLNVKSPAKVSEQPADVNLPAGGPTTENKSTAHTQLLVSSPPASAPYHFITPHLPSSTLTSSPMLPSLGITPHPDALSLPLTSSPSTRLLPRALSFSPSIAHSGVEPQISEEHADLTMKEAAGECFKTHITHTLKAAAGGSLVDACCFLGPSGTLCVAAAGKWAVCLWSQTSASDWSLKHTWTFNKPVVNVFPVPDGAGMMCVTLGQLEISEVRMLSSSSLTQKLLCEGVLQVVIGLSESRVVTSSPSATGSTLQVFKLSESSSPPTSHSLASPGVCVGALAPVDGLSDALIGTDESGRLFVWNLKSGQLLCTVVFGEDLSHTACLRGYSHCGVLFVLLQHHFLSSLEKEEEKKALKDKTKDALFSLVAVNPLSGKSMLAARLYPPAAWTNGLCEADVNGTGVVGLSQRGCVCVWELEHGGSPRTLEALETDGWQLARWGEAGVLVTGHLNGDVTLHCCN